MTPARRAAAVAVAKKAALPYAAAVRARRPGDVRRIRAGLTLAQFDALAAILAEAVDPARLKVITEEEDDGLPEHVTGGGGSRAA